MKWKRTLGTGFSALLVMAACVASGRPAMDAVQRDVAAPASYRVELPPLGRIGASPQNVKLGSVLRSSPASAPRKTEQKKAKVTRISGYVYCGSAVASAQRCIDRGSLTLYHPAGVRTLAGHNYMGWAWMDDLPVGRKVVIASGALKGTYRVYGHGWAERGSRGGRFPASGLGASVALQTCTSTGTGFSFLRRI